MSGTTHRNRSRVYMPVMDLYAWTAWSWATSVRAGGKERSGDINGASGYLQKNELQSEGDVKDEESVLEEDQFHPQVITGTHHSNITKFIH